MASVEVTLTEEEIQGLFRGDRGVARLLERRTLRTRPEAKMAVFEYIEGFNNPHRRHSALDYLSPIDYERSHERAPQGAPEP